jgi:hypothetical protein
VKIQIQKSREEGKKAEKNPVNKKMSMKNEEKINENYTGEFS